MSDFDVKEKRFEQDIEEYLITEGGYAKGDPRKFDRKLALDTETFLKFLKTSQPKQWERYEKIYGTDSEKQVVERFCREVKMVGLLQVLRQGFTDRGVKFRAVFWKPETSINITTQEQFAANILHCTRQLHYSPSNENSIDIVLFVNGIPVVSMELKCQFTGQSTTNAMEQYKFDRRGKDAIFAFKERVLVHFAVDLTQVYMTTRLEGEKTYFLPFNQGSNGAGRVGGKGNPINENGYDTAYLWQNVLCKERLLEILNKYLHRKVERDKDTGEIVSETMIFPRYHQLDVVTKLLADVKRNGSGRNYLIQHSAGSGKSNSIAWLAHRLAGLHNTYDEKIFQSVIIVTDRKVLDEQLQNTVYQFDHVEGVVQKIEKNAQQLKNAINDGSPIIITTLQKFPEIYKDVKSGNKRFAIIVDEAHSLDEVIAKINEKFKGNFTEGDKVILSALRDKLLSDKKLKRMAQSSDPQIFVESIFPKAFGTAAQDGYMEAQESYQSLFEDTAKYNAIMSALAEVVYREMRKKDIKALYESGAYTYEMPQNLSMVAEEPTPYGDRKK